jgi:TRAP-type C4-dicarboxylate transport system substrate-binding protein
LSGVGFAVPDYAHVWAAMDGDFGNALRAAAEEIGLYCMDKGYDHGFRPDHNSQQADYQPE